MSPSPRILGNLAMLCLVALTFLTSVCGQVIYIEAETVGGQNDTFAQA